MFYLFDLSASSKNYGSISGNSGVDILKPKKSPWEDEGDNEEHLRDQQWNKEYAERILNIDDAIQSLGMGIFQYRIGVAAGMLMAADSMESVILSFLSSIFSENRWDNQTQALADHYNTDTINLIVFPATLLGALFWGILGDIVGRRPVFISTAAVVALFGATTAFVTSPGWLLAARFMVGLGIGGLTVPFCTYSEFLPPSCRGTQLAYIQLFWTMGSLFAHLTLQRFNIDFWRQIVIVCTVPSIVATLLGITSVPESPRWLLTKNRQEEALEILRAAARANGKDPFNLFPEGITLYSHEPYEPLFNVFNLCSSGWMKVVSALWTTYFAFSFLDHGTVSLAVSVFSHDSRQQDYQALFSASSEVLALMAVILSVRVLGRSTIQCIAFGMAGVACLALSLLQDYNSSLNPNFFLALAFLAHMFTFGGTCAIWITTTEVLTTEMRTTGHATANAFGRIGTSLSTYLLSRIYSLPALGLVLFVVSLWTVSAAGGLPETQSKEMGVVHTPSHHHRRRIARRALATSKASTGGIQGPQQLNIVV